MKNGHDCNETFPNGITNGAFWYELNGEFLFFLKVFKVLIVFSWFRRFRWHAGLQLRLFQLFWIDPWTFLLQISQISGITRRMVQKQAVNDWIHEIGSHGNQGTRHWYQRLSNQRRWNSSERNLWETHSHIRPRRVLAFVDTRNILCRSSGFWVSFLTNLSR